MANKDSIVMTAFQTACLAIIVLVAKFIGDLIYVAVVDGFFTQRLFMFLILVSTLNFFELINNWTSIKKYFKLYNGWLFLVDVITLGCFFWQVYILSKMQDALQMLNLLVCEKNELEQKMVWVTIISYEIIFILYTVWNIVILFTSAKNAKHNNCKLKKREIIFKHSAIVRFVQACLLLFVIIPGALFGIENIPICCLNICTLLYIGYVVYHNHTLKIFKTIIRSKE